MYEAHGVPQATSRKFRRSDFVPFAKPTSLIFRRRVLSLLVLINSFNWRLLIKLIWRKLNLIASKYLTPLATLLCLIASDFLINASVNCSSSNMALSGNIIGGFVTPNCANPWCRGIPYIWVWRCWLVISDGDERIGCEAIAMLAPGCRMRTWFVVIP